MCRRLITLGLLSCAFLTLTSLQETLPPIQHYQVLFSGKDDLAEELVTLIDNEQESIHAAVYCLTHQRVANALIKAHKRGVKVDVLVDPFSVKVRSPMEKLCRQGVALSVWNPPENTESPKKRKPLMHDKFCVFGQDKVWTGSFNFTFEAARSHQENAVILESREVAQKYLVEFERLKSEGSVPYSSYQIARKKSA